MIFASRFLALTLATAATVFILLGRTAGAETAPAAPPFAVIKEAFERISTDYVDEVDETDVFRSAVLGITKAPNVYPGVLEGERVRRALKLGSRSRNVDVILRALEGVFDEIRATSAVDGQTLVDFTITEMIAGLDPHCEYLNPEAWRANQASTQNASIGVNVTMADGRVRVVSPIAAGPADRAGILADDIIVAVDGTPVAGWALVQVVNLLRGTAGSDMVLTVMRKGAPVDVKIIRARVTQESVHVHRMGRVAYVGISRFNEETTPRLKSAIVSLQAGADKVEGYIIDLRDNAGGLLDQAVGASEVFIGRGLIASTRSRNAAGQQRFEAQAADLTEGTPIVVLINEHTAAGAEIMAAALQAHRRASIVGAQSSGAGTIQTVLPLNGGRAALRLTTARVHTAWGRPLEGSGVMPDIVAEGPARKSNTAWPDAGNDPQLHAAIKALRVHNKQ